jgi:HlyD family secretion protein
MKKIIILILIGVLVITTLISVRSCGKGEEIEVSAEFPANRDIIETVSGNGKIQPEVEVKITSDVSGEIIEMYVKEGDRVKKGDLLCRIKPDIYESALDRVSASVNGSKASLQNAKAQLEQTKANLINAESIYNRTKKLYDQNAVSQQEFDAAKAQYEGAKATVKAAEETVRSAEFSINGAQASLKEASENLSKTMIYAPVDGTVSKLNVEKGERVQGVSGFQGTEIMKLANLNEMEVSVEINENDIVRVKKNDTCLIEVDAYPEKKFKGIVTEVANSANTTGISVDQVTNFTVKIRILQNSYQFLVSETNPAPFRPGMSASVEIRTNIVSNALSVPIMAVTTRADSSDYKMKKEKSSEKSNEDMAVKDDNLEKQNTGMEIKMEEVVFVEKDGKAVKVKVKTGAQDNEYIQILEGITTKDNVISGPYGAVAKKLKEGGAVKVLKPEELFSTEKK